MMDIKSVSPQMFPSVSSGIESATKAAQSSPTSTGDTMLDAFRKLSDTEKFLTSGKGPSNLAQPESPRLYMKLQQAFCL